MDAGSVIYRVLFGLGLVLPLCEILDIFTRNPFYLGEPDAFMFLLVAIGLGGLVLVDIRDRLVTRSKKTTDSA